MSGAIHLLAWLMLLPALAHADTPELAPKDFAYGRSVLLPTDASALVEIALPVDVYRASRSEGLQDVWVFNARGDAVPHALRRSTPAPAPPPSSQLLPLFPLLAQQGQPSTELSVEVSRGPAGEVLRLLSLPPAAAPSGKPEAIAGYLLDTRALTRGIHALRFTWVEPPEQLILPLTIETSADLIEWRTLAIDAGLLRLEHAGNSIERDRIELGDITAPFVRVRPTNKAAFPAPLRAVFGEPTSEAPQAVLEHLAVPGKALDAQSGVYRFDLGGPVPVERFELDLPEDNTVIAAELFTANQADGPYQRVAEARFYRIQAQGKSLSGPRLSITRQRARYYELRVDRTRLGLGTGRPTLIAFHAPDELLFLRRGEGPFTVAYGRHAVARQGFEPSDLPTGGSAQPTHASLAEPKVLGGPRLLEPPATPPPYATYALWAVLIAGVLALAALAQRLLRSS